MVDVNSNLLTDFIKTWWQVGIDLAQKVAIIVLIVTYVFIVKEIWCQMRKENVFQILWFTVI